MTHGDLLLPFMQRKRRPDRRRFPRMAVATPPPGRGKARQGKDGDVFGHSGVERDRGVPMVSYFFAMETSYEST